MGSSYILVPRSPRPIVPVVGGGFTGLNGLVTDQSSNPKGGGYVGIYAASDTTFATLLYQPLVAGDGTWSISVPAGNYVVTSQPPFGWATADAGQFAATVVNGLPTTVNFSITNAAGVIVYADDFSSYSSSGQLTANAQPIVAGNFWYHNSVTYNILGVSQGPAAAPGSITLVGGVGPSGRQVMRYSIAAYPSSGVHGNPNLVSIQTRLNPGPVVSNAYVRWTASESASFQNGGSGATGSDLEYKYFLIDLGNGAGGLGHIGVYIEGTDPNFKVTMDSTDRLTGNVNTTHSTFQSLGAKAGWTGRYNTWLLGMENCGSSNYRLFLMYQGVLVMNFTGQSFFPLQGGSVNAIGTTCFQVQIGEQLNNGPDQAWTRDWCELEVFNGGRPSWLPLVP